MNKNYLLRIESDLQLDLVDPQGNGLLSEEEKTDRISHYLRFESEFMKEEFTFENASKLNEGLKQGVIPEDVRMKDWTVTDLDDFLEGNPHIENDPHQELKRKLMQQREQ